MLPSPRSAVTGEPHLQQGSGEPVLAVEAFYVGASTLEVRSPKTLQGGPAFIPLDKQIYVTARWIIWFPLSHIGTWPGFKEPRKLCHLFWLTTGLFGKTNCLPRIMHTCIVRLQRLQQSSFVIRKDII